MSSAHSLIACCRGVSLQKKAALFLLLAPSISQAYFIEWNSPSAVSETIYYDIRTAAGISNHTHNGGGDNNGGLFLGSRTEVAASGGNVGDSRNYSVIDSITRGFVIRKSNSSEQLTTDATLYGALSGVLSYQNSDFANVYFTAEVMSTALKVSTDDTTGGVSPVNVNFSDSKRGTLAVDTSYTLGITLRTGANANWDGANAASARSNFLNSASASISVPEPATLVLLGIGLIGVAMGKRSTIIPPTYAFILASPNARKPSHVAQSQDPDLDR